MTRATTILILALAAVPGPARAQQPDTPIFRSGVDLVTADVTVVDGEGRQVRGLRPEDFTVTVDGKARSVVSVEYVSHDEPDTIVYGTPASHSANDAVAVGRLVVFVVDVGNTTALRGRAMTAAAAKILARLTPADRSALAIIPQAGRGVEFTADHAVVGQALDRISGWAVPLIGGRRFSLSEALQLDRHQVAVWEMVTERACADAKGRDENSFLVCVADLEQDAFTTLAELRGRQAASVGALRALLRRLAGVEGPKTIVLLSEGLVSEGQTGDALQLARLAGTSRASFYIIRPEGRLVDAAEPEARFTAAADERLLSEGLETVAAFTGGTLFTITNEGTRTFDRIASELSGYYLVAFRTEPADRDGDPHQIRVEVGLNRVRTRARREFRVDTAVVEKTDEEILGDVLRTPAWATGLPVRVATYTMADPPGETVRLVVSAEVGAEAERPGPMAIGFTLLRPDGTVEASGFERATLAPTDPARPSGLHYLRTTNVKPGSYRLKLAVIDQLGRRGSVEHPVEASPVALGPIRVGDLLVADAALTHTGLRPTADATILSGRLQSALSLHTSDVRALDQIRVTVEVAESEDGPALASADARLGPGDRVDARSKLAQVVIPLNGQQAGRYVARAVVTLDGRPLGRVTREFTVHELARAAAPGNAPARAASHAPGIATALQPARFRIQDTLGSAMVGASLDRLAPGAGPASRSPQLARAFETARAGQFDDLERAIEGLAPDSAEVTFLRGLARLAQGEIGPAADQFRATLKAAPEYLPAVFYLGACYAALGRDREAAGAWQTTLVSDTPLPATHTLAADALLRLGQAEQALDLLREAAASAPADEEVARRLPVAHALAGQVVEALRALVPVADRPTASAEELLLALRLLMELRTTGGSFESPAGDAQRFHAYAERYAAAGGSEGEIVAGWARAFVR